MAAALEILQETEVWPCSYHNDGYRSGFLGTVGDFQKAGVLQDVVLEVEGRRFPCHRLVLSAASPYFRAMFTGNMAESRQKTVVLQGLNPAMFEEILSYIYSGIIHVSMENVQPLYQAADLIQVDYVRETCISYMARNVEHSTCLDLYKFADDFLVGTVRDLCLQYICRYFEQVSTTAEFCSLSVDRLTEIISQDWLDVKEETTVWEAVVSWVEHSREERKQHLPIILRCVRFNLLSSDDTEAILEHPLVREDPGSLGVITNVAQRKTSNLKIRAGMDTQEMALLFSATTKEMLFMNPRTGTYISCHVTGDFTANTDVVIAMTVTSSNDIYCLTKKLRNDGRLSLLVYNHLRNMWEYESSVYRFAIADRPDEECLVEADGQLYYLAVSHRHKVDTIVQIKRHNRHTDKWAECLQLRTNVNCNGSAEVGKAVSCGPHIYFITDTEMHRYHPSNDQWCKMAAPIINPYINTAIGTTTEIICESSNLGEMCLYDTVSDSWKKLPDWMWPEEEPYHNLESDYSVYFVLEGQLHMLTAFSSNIHELAAGGTISYACQLCVLDRSKGVWTDLEVPLPHAHWLEQPNVHPVARMYLPCLNTNGTDVQNTANP